MATKKKTKTSGKTDSRRETMIRRTTARSASKLEQKFIFVTGGVVSSIGKGLTAASLGTLLEARGLSVSISKFDPYLNVDPGTMSPLQHGEVFVTEDGAETDLDLGHYERFTSITVHRSNSVSTGQVYEQVLARERRGDYLGGTVQVIPHITDEIKMRMLEAAQGAQRTEVRIVAKEREVRQAKCRGPFEQRQCTLGLPQRRIGGGRRVPHVMCVEERLAAQRGQQQLLGFGGLATLRPEQCFTRREPRVIALKLTRRGDLAFCILERASIQRNYWIEDVRPDMRRVDRECASVIRVSLVVMMTVHCRLAEKEHRRRLVRPDGQGDLEPLLGRIEQSNVQEDQAPPQACGEIPGIQLQRD